MKDLLLVMAFLAVTSLAGADLVTNGDFETGDLTGWSSNGGTVVEDNGPSFAGSYACELDALTEQLFYFGTYMPGVGETMDVQWDWKASADLNNNGYWGLFRWKRADGSMSAQFGGWHKGSVSNGEWMTRTLTTGPQPADAVSWDVAFFKANATTGTSFRVDNVSVVPEPATIALLSLGSLVAVRRKK